MFRSMTWRAFGELRLVRSFTVYAVTPRLFLCTDRDPSKKFLRKYFFVRIRGGERFV